MGSNQQTGAPLIKRYYPERRLNSKANMTSPQKQSVTNFCKDIPNHPRILNFPTKLRPYNMSKTIDQFFKVQSSSCKMYNVKDSFVNYQQYWLVFENAIVQLRIFPRKCWFIYRWITDLSYRFPKQYSNFTIAKKDKAKVPPLGVNSNIHYLNKASTIIPGKESFKTMSSLNE